MEWLRVSVRLQGHRRHAGRKYMHAAAMVQKVQAGISDAPSPRATRESDSQALKIMDKSLYSSKAQSNSLLKQHQDRGHEELSQLEMMVEGLKDVTNVEDNIETSPWDDYQPSFSENELLEVYQDLLDIVPEVSVPLVEQNTDMEQDNTVIWNLAKKLSSDSGWSSLENEGKSAESVLSLMKQCNVPSEELNRVTTYLLEFYAQRGDVAKTESLISSLTTGPPNQIQRHLHVKAHLRSTPPKVIPLNALSILHQYENNNLAPPMKTYASLIASLFSVPSSIARAQAWDLFAHMRYVAHPDPDAYIYSLMIRACASTPASGGIGVSEPERALDLFTEMTVDKMIQPTRDAYNAVILACARSGERKFVNEAFRLAREMLNGYRDSRGLSGFKPNGDLFAALLDGAKRLGDLGRVRWILAEMVKAVVDNQSSGNSYQMEVDDVKLNERIMIHVFHAYASYRVPFKREQTLLAKKAGSEQDVSESAVDQQSESQTEDVDIAEPDHGPQFSSLPPQNQSSVLAEVENLFDGIVRDNVTNEKSPESEDAPWIFKNVRITAPLLNSYLSVYYSHARFAVGRDLYRSIFEDHGIERNIHSYIEALEMCTIVNKGIRLLALKFAQEIWRDWERWIQSRKEFALQSPRLVERAHIALIRVYALNNQLDLAIEHLKAFTQSYPPKIMAKPTTNTKIPIRSTRTVLRIDPSSSATPRPLVRFTSATEVADDTVPPFVTFSDLELLHHRLVGANRVKDIKYVKWVCMSYSGALRNRRDKTLKQGVAS